MSAPRPMLLALMAVLVAGPVLLALGAGVAASEEEAHATLRDFTRTGKYVLYISKKQQTKARIYHSRRAGAFLVLDSDYGKPFLVLPRTKKVVTVEADQVLRATAKRADLKKSAKPAELTTVRFLGRDMGINTEGLVARLAPRPYALGELDAEQLLLHTPDYEPHAKRYRPRSNDIKRLNDCAKSYEVRIYFGTWCPTCKRLLPRVLSVDQKIQESKISIRYYGLPKGRAMRSEPEARKHGITRVPTAVVLLDGKRVGTISSRALSRPESAICKYATR